MKATEYITLAEAKQHLVVDASYTGDDALIESYLDNALTIVLSESCNTIEMLLDEDGALDKVAKQAVLLKLGDLYAFREGNYNGSINQVHGGYDRLIGLIRNYG